MVEPFSGLHRHISLNLGQLLRNGEVVAIVDDDQDIRSPLRIYFEQHSLPVAECTSGAELLRVLAEREVAMVLLDIGLPDVDGLSLLPQIVEQHPDTAVIMFTGVNDLQVAMDCLRKGAADYLAKPAQFEEIFHVARKALEKRRLIFENRKYQEDLEEAHFRIQILHQLSVKMNTVYLSTVELDQILRAVLVGITSREGLGFNRAFLVMFDDEGRFLRGRMAVGPSSREAAARVWGEIEEKDLNFQQIVDNLKETSATQDATVNNIARALIIPAEAHDNLLIAAIRCRRSFRVSPENGLVPVPLERRNTYANRREAGWVSEEKREVMEDSFTLLPAPHELSSILDEDSFIVTPLYSPGRAFGVIIADNYVTRRPIENNHISALELFASQASLAIEQSLLHSERQRKIAELEAVNQELDRNKDLLVAAERYSALGHMAAQLVHIIRNPITSIGGVSRILSKKKVDDEWVKYLNVIIHETERVESTLADLFDFVEEHPPEREPLVICQVVKKTILLLQPGMTRHGVKWELTCPEAGVVVPGDMRQIRQMFLHLFKNSVEAMPEGGRLSVAVTVEEGRAVIAVGDTGPGIPESYLDRAKDPFFTTKTYGTGMGLTLVERVVAAHGGSFSLGPRTGGGLEVRVVLPLV